MKKPMLRWGILGTAEIARKNWKAIYNSGNGIVQAVASREEQRCRQFIDDCQTEAPFDQAPVPFGRYQDLIEAKDVDALYIPLPTGIRKEWVLKAAETGKHIVCEKPCGIKLADVEQMVDACQQNRVQFMDGVMFMHSRRLEAIREKLDDGRAVGRLRRITSAFSFNAPADFLAGNIRVHSELEPHGCLGDLGWYCLRVILWAMNWKLPLSVTGRILSRIGRPDSPVTVPTEFSAELLFEGGISAGFYCSFLTGHQQWANISGAEGYLHVSDFVLPFFGSELVFHTQNAFFNIEGCDFNMESHLREVAVNEYSNSHSTSQETNLFRNFAEQVQSGKLNEHWPEMALKTQRVMQAALDSALADSRPVECLGE